jgi:hypothetical protein
MSDLRITWAKPELRMLWALLIFLHAMVLGHGDNFIYTTECVYLLKNKYNS